MLLVPLLAFAKGGVETFVVILQNASNVQRLRIGRLLNRLTRNLLAAALVISAPNTASAQTPLLLNLQASQAMMMLIQAGGMCVGYVYDANGNRTAQTVVTIGSTPTQWGAGTYGCFLWLV
jgi:YD repeat-containing protein